MFRIVCDPSSGSTELCLTEIALSGSQIEGRTDQRNAQINFSLINLLLFKLLQHVSATQLEPSSGSLKSLQVTSHCNLEHVIKFICTYRWSVLPSIMKMHGPKNKMVHRYFSCAWSVFGSVILNLWCVCVCTVRRAVPAHRTMHTHRRFKITLPNTDQAHKKYLWNTKSNFSQAQLSTPWWWIAHDPKHVGSDF